ncbi:MAG: hypothetical protein CL557_12330 [Alphaproteobacteria bacterium]|nr:hypothetical protein [Alphaproteobacteria bacterium]
MTYVLATIYFVKIDENDKAVEDKDGNVVLFTPKGRWKDLEYLCEGRDDDDFQPINAEKEDA